jgi:hypothetical protein
LYYNGITDEYYGVYVNDDESDNSDFETMMQSLRIYKNTIRKVDFNSEVMPVFRKFVMDINSMISPVDRDIHRRFPRDGYINSKNIAKDYRNIAKPVFNVGNEFEGVVTRVEPVVVEPESDYDRDSYHTDDSEYNRYNDDLKANGLDLLHSSCGAPPLHQLLEM